MIWEWANDPLARAVSFHTQFIPWEEHVAWFTKKMADKNCLIFIAADERGCPVGYVRFECAEDEATLSLYVDPAYRGKGCGIYLLQEGTSRLFREAAVTTIHAFVKTENTASASLFRRAGYEEQESVMMRDHPSLHFVMRKDMLSL